MKKTSHARAFSLIELSIVILIIGIIIAGVTQGSRLVRQFKIQSAQTITKSSPVASIRGLTLWLEPTLEESFAKEDGTEQTVDDFPVSQWNDINPQSSTKYFAVRDGDENIVYKDKDGPGGLPSLYFAGQAGANALTLAIDSAGATKVGLNNNAFSYFIVSNRTLDNAAARNYAFVNGPWLYGLESGAFYVAFDISYFSLPSNTNLPIISDVTYAGGVNGVVHGYGNGVSLLPDGGRSYTETIPTNTDELFYIGDNGETTGFPWVGYISEIIIYDRALKKEERQSVEDYLAKKYSIKITR